MLQLCIEATSPETVMQPDFAKRWFSNLGLVQSSINFLLVASLLSML